MDPKANVLPLCLIITLIGIFLLFLLTTLPPKSLKINQINNKLLNKQIKVIAKISDIRSYEESNFQIISIKDSTGKINAIISNQILNLKSNQSIIIIGKITEYNHTLQITADKIINIS